MVWTALTAIAVALLVALFGTSIWLVGKTIGFLQPLLLPVAIAGILAFLLEPLVQRLGTVGISRRRAVLLVFGVVSLAALALLGWLIPALYVQSIRLGSKLPGYTVLARDRLVKLVETYTPRLNLPALLPGAGKPQANPSPGPTDPSATPAPAAAPTPALQPPAVLAPTPAPAGDADPTATPAGTGPPTDPTANPILEQVGGWMNQQLPTVTSKAWAFVQRSVGGFLGVFGFLFSMIVVPLYLYYFLIESRSISSGWAHYLPLRASHFKDEVVSCLTEINSYLIAFFRGQLVVSLINGVATGLGLLVIGLDFGLLIGLMLCVLGIIPYLGIMLCWVPAVIIAIVQGHSYLIPSGAWWVLPLVVTAVFVVVQQIDGLFITPRIVGESVGLHPVTVIISVFGWSLLLGGLLGALLAVPLSATLKVLLRRYVWERRLNAPVPSESEVSP